MRVRFIPCYKTYFNMIENGYYWVIERHSFSDRWIIGCFEKGYGWTLSGMSGYYQSDHFKEIGEQIKKNK